VLWFSYPRNWFIFDRFVADALRIGHRNDPPQRLHSFQKVMEDLGASELVAQISDTLENRAPGLHAERVIDKMLMFIGMSLFEPTHPDDGPPEGPWAAPDEQAFLFADETLEAFENSDLVGRLRRLSIP